MMHIDARLRLVFLLLSSSVLVLGVSSSYIPAIDCLRDHLCGEAVNWAARTIAHSPTATGVVLGRDVARAKTPAVTTFTLTLAVTSSGGGCGVWHAVVATARGGKLSLKSHSRLPYPCPTPAIGNAPAAKAASDKLACPLPDCPSTFPSASAPASQCWSAPAYASSTPPAFRETCVQVPSLSWTLHGALTVPISAHGHPYRYPAVLLVGGSGPTDMDGTEGPNKPLKDLAWGLASRGVASLRVNKRAAQYGVGSFPNGSYALMTIESEYTQDVVAALRFLAAQPGVDATRVVLAGHSEGAEVAPGVAKFGGFAGLAGVVLLAAPGVSLPSLLAWQYYYLTGFNSNVAALMAACVGLMQSPALLPSTLVQCDPALKWPPIYGAYYLSERRYDPPTAVVQGLRLPVLVLQGQADYNVPYAIPAYIPLRGQAVPTFLNTWAVTFAGATAAGAGAGAPVGAGAGAGAGGAGRMGGPRPAPARVALHSFPCLNHLFMAANCSGLATPAQSLAKGNVEAAVVERVAAWVLALPGA